MTQVTGNVTATHLTYATYNALVNGDFETATIDPWDTTMSSGGGAAFASTDYGVTGYGCRLICNPEKFIMIQQDLPATLDIIAISFDYKFPFATETQFIKTILDGDEDWYDETAYSTTDWVNYSTIITPFSTERFILYPYDDNDGSCEIWLDNIIVQQVYSGNISTATIEDSSKTWTADQFNTDGMFILTSGDVKGYSCSITDTFTNYIQVPTTFANIINNIETGTTYYPATIQLINPSFEDGDFTGWTAECQGAEEDRAATIYVQSSTKYTGSYAVCADGWSDGYPDSTGFSLCTATFDITEITKITFWYNIPTLVSGGNVYLRVRVATDGDGETPVVVSEDYHSVTDGWVQGVLNVATLSGTAYLHFCGYVPLPEW